MKKIILGSFFLLISLASFAYDGPGDQKDDQDPSSFRQPLQTPIDGGVSILIGCAVAYAGKKYHDYKKGGEK